MKKVDLSKIKPLTLGDMEKLEELGLDTANLDKMKAKDTIKFLHYFCAKADPAITEDDVRDYPTGYVKAISERLNAEPDKDFLST